MNCVRVGLVVLIVSLVLLGEVIGAGEGGCNVDETYAYVGCEDPVT